MSRLSSAPSEVTVDSPFSARTSPPTEGAPSAFPDFGPRYRVESLLGEGGMGTVYKAWDKELDRTVALKLIRHDLTRDPTVSQRFKQELLLASKISHRNVLRIHDLGDGPGDTKFISMACIDGPDLQHVLRKQGKLPIDRAVNLGRQLCSALEAAHAEGVVHRDLKPQNILIDKNDHIYVSDFGLAKSLESDLNMTQTGQFLGTPRYMSPEQAEIKRVDHRSDLYAFGLILCEMLTGSLPFDRAESAMQMLYQRVHESPRDPRLLNHDLPEYIASIIQKCLQRDVEQRYQSAAEILADLDEAHAPASSRYSWVAANTSEVLRKPKTGWIIAAGVLVIAIAAFVWEKTPSHTLRSSPTPVPPISLAILPFRNSAGDTSIDWISSSLAEILSTDVGQSAQLHTVSPNRTQQLFDDLKISSNTALDPSTIRRIAEFTSADRVVWGQYAKFGEQIRIDATMEDIKSGQSANLTELATEKTLLSAIDHLAKDIRSKLFLSQRAVKAMEAGAMKPSTSSLTAIREYEHGLQLERKGNFLDAAKQFEAATKDDSNFVLAYSELAKTYSALGQDDEAEFAAQKAVVLSEPLPQQEKYLILANQQRIQRNYPKAIEAYQNIAKAAPGDADVLFELGGLYENSSAYDKARLQYMQVLDLDPKRVGALLAMGRVEIYLREYEKALEFLAKAEALSVEGGNDEIRAEIFQATGVCYAGLNKHQDALRNFHDSIEIKRRLGLKRGIAMSLDAMATSEDILGQPDQALKDYQEALTVWRELGDKAGTGDVLSDLAEFYVDHGKYDQGLDLFKQSLQAEIEVGNQNNQALVLNNIGNAYTFKGDYQNARTYFEQALALREKLHVPMDIADTLHNLAETSSKMGQFDLALEQYLKALDLRHENGDKRGAAIESSGMGILFGYQGRYGAAVSSEEDAVRIFRDLQDRSVLMAEFLAYYGSVLAQVGRHDEATKALNEALGLARELKNPDTIGEIQSYEGDDAFYAGDYKTAARFYDDALKTLANSKDSTLRLLAQFDAAKVALRQRRGSEAASTFAKLSTKAEGMGLKYVSVECSIYHAEVLVNLHGHELAKKELETALARSQKLGLQSLLARSHYLLARNFELTGNTAEALEHYREARRIVINLEQDAKTDTIVKRSDLSPIYSHAID
ncbi:MAG TPA: tetratricopeptide repeat protein [Verrucomicrobiae bacterium]|nr:tetratricopeptide repeat protein [Verrucomicrobiae bacterium]